MATLPGDNGPNNIDGTGDADVIVLQGADDSARGLGGADVIDGGLGNDTLYGGAGNDRLFSGPTVESGKDSLYGGAGDDEVSAGFGDFGDLADGGAGIDLISLDYRAGFSVQNTPLIILLQPTFLVFAGAAQGISLMNFERLFVLASAGNDHLRGGLYADLLDGGVGNDTLEGSDGNHTLNGGRGNFSIDGGAGTDLLGLDMSDRMTGLTIEIDLGGDVIVTGVGSALDVEFLNVNGSGGDDTLRAGGLDDSLNGWTGNDLIEGFAGNDRIDGYEGNDLLYGGDGNDQISGGNQNDRAFGGNGNDYMNEAPVLLGGNDRYYGGKGNDTIFVGAGDDLVYGGTGNDRIELDAGQDTGYGGAGNDTISDDLYSPSGSDLIFGGSGHDTIRTSQGSDTVQAEDGDDSVQGYTHSGSLDVLDGGAGTDLLTYSFSSGGTAAGTMVLNGTTVEFWLGGILHANATAFEAFQVFGDLRADVLFGGGGADRMVGNGGYLPPGSNPTLDRDTLRGGSGDDTLVGREGRDLLYGGQGADDFVYEKLTDSGVPVAQRDIIFDFQTGIDQIDLSRIDTDPVASGDQEFLVVTSFSNAPGQVTIAANGAGRWLLSADRDGDALADLVIDVRGALLVAGDLIL